MEKLEDKHLAPYLPYGLIMCEEVQRTDEARQVVIHYDKGELFSYLGTQEPHIVWIGRTRTGLSRMWSV